MPAPDALYLEIETAKKHGGWGAWMRLPAVDRGKLMAHEMHSNMRQHYEFDQRQAPEKAAEKKDSASPWSAMRKRFFAPAESRPV